MNKTPVDIDRFLPFGEMLRGFLEQPFLTKAELASMLRERGIFTFQSDKRDTVPWITNLLLSPVEFDRLQEAQRTKEDNPKVNTQTIPWSSSDNLIDSVPDNFDINSVLDLEFSNFTVIGSPNFVPIDGDANHLLLEFEIERKDYSKNWASAENQFKGSLELKKIRQGAEVKLVVTHTANETKYVANKASAGLIKHFKDRKHIKDTATLKKITFDLFTNPGRTFYFLSLSQNIASSLLKFEDLVDVEFAPDKEAALPEKIQWMEKRIEDLKLNGKGLHDTFFVKDKDLQPFVHLYHILARYAFDYKGLLGKCVVSIGFPEYARTKEALSELEVNVKSVSFEQAPKYLTRSQMIKIILGEFDNLKLAAVDKLKPEHVA